MNLLNDTRTVLETAGYRTLASGAATNRFFFEDASILGLVIEYESAQFLVDQWEKVQDGFLGEFAGQLRSTPSKAWNIYTVHLTSDSTPNQSASKLFAIEEDFRGTRKIARAGISSKESLRTALLPLLPIQNQISLTRADMAEQLKRRLLASDVSLVNLLVESSPSDLAQRLMEGN